MGGFGGVRTLGLRLFISEKRRTFHPGKWVTYCGNTSGHYLMIVQYPTLIFIEKVAPADIST
jgi:hypothetical protein